MGELTAESSDLELVERARRGNHLAFRRLIDRHRSAVESLLRRYLKNATDVEDVSQQAFELAYRSLPQFRGECAFGTWLHRISINTALSYLRTRKRLPSIAVEDVQIITNALGTTRMAGRQALARLAVAISALPPKQRLVVQLRLVEEMPFADIATAVGCSEDSARANFHHATRRLREMLG